MMTAKGIVFNVERFAIHDGPGIRTVVFLKGCPLRCVWCSTVDSQYLLPEMEYFADKCTGCGKCIEICTARAIYVAEDGRIITERHICNNCGKCVDACPNGARKTAGEEMIVEQVLEEVEKDIMFYSNSAGGVTLSGGEPTMQPEFSLEILKGCKRMGIHTAIETCGYVEWDILDEMLRYLDFVYMDIKHMSPEEHKRLTSKKNSLILANARKVAEKYPDKPFVIRIPVIPGCNDSDENIAGTAQFVGKLEGTHRIELLPYHRLGVPKYGALSKDYALSDLQSLSEDRMNALVALVESYGIEAQIGG
jgi:pyruvate formate lyase activating enzyme